MATQIEVGTASEERIEPFLRLTETHYQGKAVNAASVVRWRHLEGPLGPSATVELVDRGESVGRMWIRTHSWSIRGQVVKSANPVDFLIREDHRKLPAFLSLFKATMNESQIRAELVYHTSNPLTDELYQKLMKLKPVTELDGAVVPIRPFGVAQAAGVLHTGALGRAADLVFTAILKVADWISRLGGIRLVAPPGQPEQVRVVQALLAEEAVCGSRLPEYRSWRFAGAGPVQYKEQWVTYRGRTIGYLVTSDRDVEGLKATFVIDVVLPGTPSQWAIRSLWFQAAGLAAKRGRQAVFFLHNKANPRLARLASFPMFALSRARLPQRVPVFVRPSKGADSTIFEGVDLTSGYYVLSDFDMF